MTIWNFSNIRKFFEAPRRVPEILSYVPGVVGFPENGNHVTERLSKLLKRILALIYVLLLILIKVYTI